MSYLLGLLGLSLWHPLQLATTFRRNAFVGRATFVAKMLHPINHTMSLSKYVAAHTQGAPRASAFNPHEIRSVAGQNGQPALAILEGVALVKPEWSYSQAQKHWHAFCASRGLAPATKTLMPKNKRNHVPAMLTTDARTLADVIMSLPGSCPNYLQNCAAALLRCYHIEPPPAFVYEPVVASQLRQAKQKEPHAFEAEGVQAEISEMALPAPVPETKRKVPQPSTLAATGGASLSLASAMPQDAVSQVGCVFQGSRFCLRALQDINGVFWFKGNEVASALGYANLQKAIRDHVHVARRQKMQNIALPRVPESVTLSKYEQEATWVTEPGVWQLVLASQTEPAEQFRLWFTGEVLPQLARTGTYSMQPQLAEAANDDLQALQFEKLAAHADADRQRAENLRLQSRLLRLELASKAAQITRELGLNVTPAQRTAAQLALDAAALPPHVSENSFTTAGEYLRMRGHSEAQVRSLQVTFGVMLKKYYQQVHGTAPPAHFHAEFGGEVKTPCSYDRQADRELLNGTYQLLTLTDTYRKQVPNELLALNCVA